MKTEPHNAIESAKSTFHDVLSKIPFIHHVEILPEPETRHGRPDIVLSLQLPENSVQLIVEVRTNGQPRLAREAVMRLKEYRKGYQNVYAVFSAPYITDKAAEICRQEGVGYMDLSGNCLLSFDKIYIKQVGNPNRFYEKRDLRSLYSPKAERILRVLLNNPERRWKVQVLANESRVSLGQISNIKKLLNDREWISIEKNGFSLTHPKALLDEWSENHGFGNHQIQEYILSDRLSDFEQKVAAYCMTHQTACALTGFSGAFHLAPSIRYDQIHIYSPDIPQTLLSGLSIRKVESGGNLFFIIPYDEGVFYGKIDYRGVPVVSPIQLYLDLRSMGDTGAAAAEKLFKLSIRRMCRQQT